MEEGNRERGGSRAKDETRRDETDVMASADETSRAGRGT